MLKQFSDKGVIPGARDVADILFASPVNGSRVNALLHPNGDFLGRLARAFGDRMPLDGDSHFSGGRDAFYYHVRAKECLRQAQTDSLLAALRAQTVQGEGCFTCHNFRGRGGKIAPDLAAEGTRGRSEAWLIGHFKDPQAYSPASVMPALSGLTNRQLKVLATFLQHQEEGSRGDLATFKPSSWTIRHES